MSPRSWLGPLVLFCLLHQFLVFLKFLIVLSHHLDPLWIMFAHPSNVYSIEFFWINSESLLSFESYCSILGILRHSLSDNRIHVESSVPIMSSFEVICHSSHFISLFFLQLKQIIILISFWYLFWYTYFFF